PLDLRGWDETFPVISVPLLLRCHDIKSNLWEAVDQQLLRNDIDKECKESFFKFIRENQSGVLFVLDGLDEADQGKIGMFIDLAQGKELAKCLFVFTSRHESGIKLRRYCDNLWEIVGLTWKDAEQFIYKYFKNMEHLANRLLEEILTRSASRQLMSNPLNTALLCILCEDFKETFPESRTEFYIENVRCVLRRYEEKKGFSSDSEDLIEVYAEELRCLGRIALRSLLKGELYVEESKVTGNRLRPVNKFGFLSVQSGGSKRKPYFRYGFLHKSFQEFFAGFHLALTILSEDDEGEIAITDERLLDELNQVILFMSGIVVLESEESAKRLLRRITARVNMLGEKSLSSNTFLTNLDLKLSRAGIGETDAASLFKALSVNTTLTNLDMASNQIGASGAASLSQALSVNTALTKLNLRSNNIGASGVGSLSQALSVNATLTQLDLSSINIGASGVGSLSQALSVNATLTQLDLSSNNIGASGAASLSQALSVNTTLTQLDLDLNTIGDSGAASQALSQALSINTTLTRLGLDHDNISDFGAASLSQALSAMQYYIDPVEPSGSFVNTKLTHF
ncbi:protein NLRC3-like, partial [Stylophora pistillata]|uniref:protein NLRC3-like n=1 Tax=Stylophora pistillata TaxID=50429 RepID=UPI000C03ED7C